MKVAVFLDSKERSAADLSLVLTVFTMVCSNSYKKFKRDIEFSVVLHNIYALFSKMIRDIFVT